MKKVFLVIAMVFATSCEDVDGVLKVFNEFSVNTKDGVIVAKPGTYQTSVDIRKDRIKATLTIDNEKIKVVVRVPEDRHIPSNGEYEISAIEAGQPFAVRGKNKTTTSKSDIQRSYQDCTYTYYEVVCGPGGCQQFPVTRWGQQQTEYYVRTVKKDYLLNVLDADLSKTSVGCHIYGVFITF